MIIQKNEQSRKGEFREKHECRFRPSKPEGVYIQYRLRQSGFSLLSVGHNVGTDRALVNHVIYGRRRSRRVENEIARILGKAEWNDVVIEARLAVANPAYTPAPEDIRTFKERELANFMALVDPQSNFAQTRSDLGIEKEAV